MCGVCQHHYLGMGNKHRTHRREISKQRKRGFSKPTENMRISSLGPLGSTVYSDS